MSEDPKQSPSIEEILKKVERHRIERESDKDAPFPLTLEESRIYTAWFSEEEEKRRRREWANRVSKNSLALWPDEVAAMPTEITRTALFGLPRRGRRKVHQWVVIASRTDIELKYFGEDLDQADLDVWLLVLRIARGQNIGSRIQSNMNAMLKALHRENGGSDRRWLASSLDRLSTSTFKVRFQRSGKFYEMTTGLLKWGRMENTGKMYIRIDPDDEALFKNLSYINFESRLSLPSSLAKAIHVYASGHKRGRKHAVNVANLKDWTGYGGRLVDFIRASNTALRQLEYAGILSCTEIGTDQIVRWILNK